MLGQGGRGRRRQLRPVVLDYHLHRGARGRALGGLLPGEEGELVDLPVALRDLEDRVGMLTAEEQQREQAHRPILVRSARSCRLDIARQGLDLGRRRGRAAGGEIDVLRSQVTDLAHGPVPHGARQERARQDDHVLAARCNVAGRCAARLDRAGDRLRDDDRIGGKLVRELRHLLVLADRLAVRRRREVLHPGHCGRLEVRADDAGLDQRDIDVERAELVAQGIGE